MILQFTERERNYIVNSEETNLLLTEVGMRLVDKLSAHDGLMCIEATSTTGGNHNDRTSRNFAC